MTEDEGAIELETPLDGAPRCGGRGLCQQEYFRSPSPTLLTSVNGVGVGLESSLMFRGGGRPRHALPLRLRYSPTRDVVA